MVMNLHEEEHNDLALRLHETSLPAVPGRAAIIQDRLNVLTGLEALVFAADDRGPLRERAELRRLVAENTWLFGEEFHLMAEDEGLTRCLAGHADARGVHVVSSDPTHNPSRKRGCAACAHRSCVAAR